MPCGARRSRGFTLVEIMVAGLLSMLLLFVLLDLLLPAMRLSARGSTLVDIDQRVGLLEVRLERAVKSTGLRGVRVYDNGRYLSVHPVLGAVADSKPKLSSKLTAFVWADDRLREYELSLPQTPLMLTGLPIESVPAALASGKVLRTMNGVTLFEAKLMKEPVVKVRFRVAKDKESLEVSRTIWMTNN